MADNIVKSEDLTEILGEENVKSELKVTAKFAVDNLVPKAVAFPKNTDQVSEVVKFANRENLAMVARGSGTKMTMGNPPQNRIHS